MTDHPSDGAAEGGGDDRVEAQRQQYRELLEELRTILPGVQVLFAFLLTVPFASRFGQLDGLGRGAFAAALVASAAATIMFLTPAAYHRLTPHGSRSRRLAWSVRMQLAGMVLVAFAISDAVFVVTRFIFSTWLGVLLGGATGAVALLLWGVVPVVGRGDDD